MKRTLVSPRTCFLPLNPRLVVAGTRSTRAASPVTVGSMPSFFCTHRRLNASATGFHSEISTASVSGQYACTPPPEATSHGLPKAASPTSSVKVMMACAARRADAYALGFTTPLSSGISLGWLQSTSIAMHFVIRALAASRLFMSPNVVSAK